MTVKYVKVPVAYQPLTSAPANERAKDDSVKRQQQQDGLEAAAAQLDDLLASGYHVLAVHYPIQFERWTLALYVLWRRATVEEAREAGR